jgi:hypothetical protein
MWQTEVDVVTDETSGAEFAEEARRWGVEATCVMEHGPGGAGPTGLEGWPVYRLTAPTKETLKAFLDARYGDVEDEFIEEVES